MLQCVLCGCDTGIISNLLHKKKTFKRNGTFETHLAPKAKQNKFHHKMVNNKKKLFLTRDLFLTCNLYLEEKLNILKEKDAC